MSLDTTKAVRFRGKVSNWVNSFPASAKMLTIDANGDVAYQDIPSSSSVSWGDITGTLSAQTDLQSALDGKASSSHTHGIADVTGLQAALDSKAATSHSHVIADTTGLQTALDSKLNLSGGTLTGGLVGTDISLSGNVTVVSDAWFGLGSNASRFMPRTGGARIYAGSNMVAEFIGGATTLTGNLTATGNSVTIGQRAIQDGELRLNSSTGSGGIAIRGKNYGADFWTEVSGNWASYHHARLVLGGMYLRSADEYGWSSTSAADGTVDLRILRDAANTLAQRNGTTAQTNRIYRTYTSGSVNHHYAIITNNGSNGYDIGTYNTGVTNYATRLVNNGNTMIEFAANNTDIILRQRSLTFGSANSGEVVLRQVTAFSGVLNVIDAASASTYNDIALRQLIIGGAAGATTSRIKNTSGTINFRLGNDSADANITAAQGAFSSYITSGIQTLSADPTTVDITMGLSRIVKNSTSGELRLWANDGGTMKSVLLS